MKNKSILFICNDFSDVSDGGKIYDFKFSNSLKTISNLVDIHFIDCSMIKTIPFWVKSFDNTTIKLLKEKSKKYEIVIISHESLGKLAIELNPNLFIIHNLFSHFKSPNFFLNSFYRFCSLSFEKKILKNSKNVLFLSKREFKIIKDLGYNNILCEPPGLKSIEFPKINNYNTLKIINSYDWIAKRLSKSTESEIECLSKKFTIEYKENNQSNCVFIEDNFVVGFKLKLIEAIYNGDFIFSKVDLKDEIIGLGLNADNYILVNNCIEIDNCININIKAINLNRDKLIKYYQWDNIVGRVINQI